MVRARGSPGIISEMCCARAHARVNGVRRQVRVLVTLLCVAFAFYNKCILKIELVVRTSQSEPPFDGRGPINIKYMACVVVVARVRIGFYLCTHAQNTRPVPFGFGHKVVALSFGMKATNM